VQTWQWQATGNRRRGDGQAARGDRGVWGEHSTHPGEATSGNSQRLFLVLKFEREDGWKREWDACHALMLIAQSVGLSSLTWLEAMWAWHTNKPWFVAIDLRKICSLEGNICWIYVWNISFNFTYCQSKFVLCKNLMI